jgi:predicted RND superfamily exporter protein
MRLLLRVRRPEMLKRVEGMLVGEDHETAAIVLRLQPPIDTSVSRAPTFDRIREMAAAHVPPAFVVGEPILIHDMFQYVEDDGRMLFRVSLVLLAGVIFVLFRSLRWVVLPLLVVASSVLWTEATLVLSGLRLSMVSSMLSSLLTIIGVQTAMHIIVHFRDLRTQLGPVESLRRTIVELSSAIFWIVVTTAAGFGALFSSDVSPASSFGLMMSLGSMMVLVAVVAILPGAALLGRDRGGPRFALGEEHLSRLLANASLWVDRRPVRVAVTAVLVFVLAAAGFYRLEIETDFSKNFRASSPIVKSLEFVETRLGGAGTWEVNFPAPGELTPEYLDHVRGLAERLRAIGADGGPRLTKVIAITDILDLVPRMPFAPGTIRDKLDSIAEFQPEYESSLYAASAGRMRLVLRARERQPSASKLALIETVDRIAKEEFEGATTTGLFVLMTHIIESLLRDQIVSLVLASAGVAAMMAVAFSGIRIGVLSLVPNLLPIALVVGYMGWAGMPINMGTAMIASVSLGFTVDFSIHYLSGFRRARAAGRDFSAALVETNRDVGRALVFATLALIAGFSVLTLSHFIPMVHFGLLVSFAMIGGLLGNLGLLPLMLRFIEPRDAAEKRSEEPLNSGTTVVQEQRPGSQPPV